MGGSGRPVGGGSGVCGVPIAISSHGWCFHGMGWRTAEIKMLVAEWGATVRLAGVYPAYLVRELDG